MNKTIKVAFITGGLGIIGAAAAALIGLIKIDDNNNALINNSELEIGNQSQVVMGNNNNVENNYNITNNIFGAGIENDSIDSLQKSEFTYVSLSEESLSFDFSEEMKNIFRNEQRIKKQKGNYIYSSLYPEVSFCYISGTEEICLIEVVKGFRNINYSRTYQFNENGNLSFALIVDDIGEHRLYFYDNTLIRYRDENGQNYDINYDLDTYECKFEELVLKESYELFNDNSDINNDTDNISSDSEWVTVPNVIELTQEEAVEILKNKNLEFQVWCYEEDIGRDSYRVAEQSIPENSKVKSGTKIQLRLY